MTDNHLLHILQIEHLFQSFFIIIMWRLVWSLFIDKMWIIVWAASRVYLKWIYFFFFEESSLTYSFLKGHSLGLCLFYVWSYWKVWSREGEIVWNKTTNKALSSATIVKKTYDNTRFLLKQKGRRKENQTTLQAETYVSVSWAQYLR